MNQETKNENSKKFGISREEPLLELNNKYLSPPSQITENVYLGNIYDARNLERLQKLGINKVLSIITDPNLVSYPESIEHKLIDIADYPKENIIKYFGECLSFINDDNKKVFVHCFGGASRSASIIIAYLMWKNAISYEESFDILKKLRPIINPNDGFIKQLQIFDKLLRKNKYNINKIKFEEIKYIP